MAEFECPYCGKEYTREYFFDQHVESCDERDVEEEASGDTGNLNPVHPQDDAVASDAPCYQE